MVLFVGLTSLTTIQGKQMKKAMKLINTYSLHIVIIMCMTMIAFMGNIREHFIFIIMITVVLAIIVTTMTLSWITYGKLYTGGEVQALKDIRSDIDKSNIGDTVTICGTATTGSLYMIESIRESLKRGVKYEIIILDKSSQSVSRLRDIESDIKECVVNPIINLLKDIDFREIMGAEWCNWWANTFENCGEDKYHYSLIDLCEDAWREIDRLVAEIQNSGELKVDIYKYDLIPFTKLWRIKNTTQVIYYAADYMANPGVGLNSPMRRFIQKNNKNISRSRRLDSFVGSIKDYSISVISG